MNPPNEQQGCGGTGLDPERRGATSAAGCPGCPECPSEKQQVEVPAEAVDELAKLLCRQVTDQYGRRLSWGSFADLAKETFRERARQAWPALLQVAAPSIRQQERERLEAVEEQRDEAREVATGYGDAYDQLRAEMAEVEKLIEYDPDEVAEGDDISVADSLRDLLDIERGKVEAAKEAGDQAAQQERERIEAALLSEEAKQAATSGLSVRLGHVLTESDVAVVLEEALANLKEEDH